jgi:hypothetical protein
MQVAKAMGRVSAPWRRGWAAGALALALGLTGPAWGGQASATFAVNVDLHTSPDTGACQSSPEAPSAPSVVTIDCRNGQPLDPATPPSTPPASAARDARAYRFMIPTGDGDLRYGGVDLYAGAGTITSWRVVHYTDWDYLEMTVGW